MRPGRGTPAPPPASPQASAAPGAAPGRARPAPAARLTAAPERARRPEDDIPEDDDPIWHKSACPATS
ncbi:hypothetical protein GCM10017687_84000 [Streptomyces echinatus]